MKSLILALHAGHNASAVIGDESGLRFAIQEERLNGEKNFWGFPRRAIKACLDAVHASPRDLACVAYAGQQVLSRYHTRDDVLDAYRRQSTLTGKLRQRIAMPLMVALRPSFGQSALSRDLSEAGLGEVPVVHHDHHLCHAATAYYGLRDSTSERSTVLTCDGAGDGICATVHEFGPHGARELARTPWEHSLGALYSWVTFILGFVPLEHEYKLMGMAPYASASAAEKAAKIFEAYLGLAEDGLNFQKKTPQRTNDLGERIFSDTRGMRFDHICAGLQKFTEDLLVTWAENAVRRTNVPRVLAAGGVFMNVKANKRIAESKLVDSFEAFPSCGDETIPMGAFWLEAAKRWGNETVPPLRDFYLGDDLDPAATDAAVRSSGFTYSKPESMPQALVELLVAGHPVARCAGRMEFGARALGNRSILADPSNSDVVRVINQAVKKRDFWMPFAPMILEESQDRYIDNPKRLESPYMMMTFDSKENFRELIAAVHNADLTCRAQLLRRDHNPEMYAIAEEFQRRTGRGVVLNTSFNLHGYPIVRTAEDALNVLRNSGLGHLQVGPYLVHKA
jgi:carbamoyltransferase